MLSKVTPSSVTLVSSTTESMTGFAGATVSTDTVTAFECADSLPAVSVTVTVRSPANS